MSSLNNNPNSMPIVNKLDIRKYLIPLQLHQEMFEQSNKQYSKSNGFVPINKYTADGIYLVSFRRLNKNSNTLIYNYIKYPMLFQESLIVYLLLRTYYINYKEFSDKHHFFVVLESSLRGDYIKPVNNDTGINLDYISPEVKDYIDNIRDLFNIDAFINLLNQLIYIGSLDDICYIIDKSVKKDFDSLIRFILYGFPISDTLIKYKENNILNSSLYVVKDLQLFIENIIKCGYTVNEGPQKWRGQINSISSFLSVLDCDFRESLYNHYQYHKSIRALDPKIYSPLKPRSFSFNTIHQNMGSVRWYSVSSRPRNNRSFHTTTTNLRVNRTKLFEDNYVLLKDVINKNKNLSKEDLQKNIEEMLFNQEVRLADENIIKSRLNFSEAAYNFLNTKRSELIKLLSVPYKTSKRVSFSNELLPWCERIQDALGIKAIVDILMSYFMLVLTRENVSVEDNITPGIPTITAYAEFGQRLYNKYIYVKYLEYQKSNSDNNLTLTQFMLSKVEFDDIDVDEDLFYPRIGGYFLSNLYLANMLVEKLDQSVIIKKEITWYIRIHPDCRNIFITNDVRVLHLPMRLPMICPPKPYVYNQDPMKNRLGGYLLNDVLYSRLIMNKKIGYGEQTKIVENNTIIDEVNGLASIPYKINRDTLDFVLEYGITKNILLDPEKHNLDKFLSNPYKGFTKRDSKKYRSLVSKLLLERNILNIALIYSNFDKIYFPTRLDFRIRVYCDAEYLHYQANDLARGLILFAEPGKILKHDTTAINYFKAYGANMFGDGLDKKSLNYRVKWVDEHSNILLNFYNNNIVDKAENKVSFISFCFEYKRFIDFIKDKNRSVFYTYLPIQLDARCNCYQHLALLTKENVIYDKLNLSSSNFDEDPNDFYTFMLNRINIYINNKVEYLKSKENLDEKDKELLNSYEILLKVSFGRSIVKKTIMTNSYHAGLPKLIDFICNNLEEHYEGNSKYYIYNGSDIRIKRIDVKYYVVALKHVLDSEAPRIKALSNYLDSVAILCSKLEIPIPWKLPNGAEISGSYLVSETDPIRAFSFVKTRYTFTKYLKGKYDLKQQKRSLPPNLIHSLDATTISLLYRDFKKIGPIFTIHDCFAVTADNVDKLISKLRLVYTELYSDAGYLMRFDHVLRANINNKLGDKGFKIDSDTVYILSPNEKKIIELPFPDVNKVLNYDLNNLHFKNAMESSYLLI